MATFGIIISNRSFFPDHLVRTAREKLLKSLDAWGHRYVTLSPEDTNMGQTMTYEEAVKCAELFRRHADEIDGIIVCLPNFGEETGIADAIRLSRLDCPILIQACDDDLDKLQLENRRDAFCGKLSLCNNLYQYGIKYSLTTRHTCPVDGEEFHADVERFARVCAVVKALRTARIAQIGARVTPFRTVRYSEKLLQNSGISVETEDMSEIFADIDEIPEADAQAKAEEIRAYANICPGISEEKVLRQARLVLGAGKLDARPPLRRQRHPVLGQRRGQLRLRGLPGHEHDGLQGHALRLRDGRDGRRVHAGAPQGRRRAAHLSGLGQQLRYRAR